MNAVIPGLFLWRHREADIYDFEGMVFITIGCIPMKFGTWTHVPLRIYFLVFFYCVARNMNLGGPVGYDVCKN